MRLNCRRYIKSLCLHADGLLEPETLEDLERHLTTCAHCREFRGALEKSRSITDSLSVDDDDYLSSQQIKSLVNEVAVGLDKGGRNYGRTRVQARLFPRLTFATLSGTLAGILSVLALVLYLDPETRMNLKRYFALREISGPEEVLDAKAIPSLDVFQWLNNGCAVKSYGADLRVVAVTQRSVHLQLNGGEVFIAGVQGAYDTIQIHSGLHTVRTRGTKFSLRMNKDSLAVDVIEGSVDIAEKRTHSAIRLEAGLSALFVPDSSPAIRHIAALKFDSLCVHFSDLSNETCTQDLKSQGNAKDDVRADYPEDAQGGGEDGPHGPYERALALYRKGMFPAAIDTLERYNQKPDAHLFKSIVLMADCYNRLGSYRKAVTYYQRASILNSHKDGETAIHIANRLLLFKLEEFEEAKAEIKRYLDRYPEGYYRETQLQYLIRIYTKQGRIDKAKSAMRKFLEQYPESCRSRQYANVLEKMSG